MNPKCQICEVAMCDMIDGNGRRMWCCLLCGNKTSYHTDIKPVWQCSGCHWGFMGEYKEICPACGKEKYWTGSVALDAKIWVGTTVKPEKWSWLDGGQGPYGKKVDFSITNDGNLQIDINDAKVTLCGYASAELPSGIAKSVFDWFGLHYENTSFEQAAVSDAEHSLAMKVPELLIRIDQLSKELDLKNKTIQELESQKDKAEELEWNVTGELPLPKGRSF